MLNRSPQTAIPEATEPEGAKRPERRSGADATRNGATEPKGAKRPERLSEAGSSPRNPTGSGELFRVSLPLRGRRTTRKRVTLFLFFKFI